MASARCAISMASSRVTWLWLSSPSLSRMMARRDVADLRRLQQLVAAGKIKRVVERRAAAGTQFVHSARQQLGIVGEILRNLGRHVKAHHKRLVVARTNRLVQKLDRRFLLELEAVAHRIAGIDQQPDLQRQVGFGVESCESRPAACCRPARGNRFASGR